MSDLMREEFERTNGRDHRRNPPKGNNYIDPMAQEDWDSFQKGWKQSRECLVIKLPQTMVARGYGEQVAEALGFNDGINYCEEAIHAAGVKTK